jgi:uncharacterized protein (TIGR02466 family)
MATIDKITLFPTLIYHIHDFINDEELLEIKKNIKKNKKDLVINPAFTPPALSTHRSYNNNFLLNFPSVKEKLIKVSKLYGEDTGFKCENKINNSWFNIQKKGSMLTEHIHEMAYFSGALFIQVDNKSTELFFYNPNPFLRFSPTGGPATPYNFEWFKIIPKNKSLVLFPAWLLHGSKGNKNKSIDRISIGFNII